MQAFLFFKVQSETICVPYAELVLARLRQVVRDVIAALFHLLHRGRGRLRGAVKVHVECAGSGRGCAALVLHVYAEVRILTDLKNVRKTKKRKIVKCMVDEV
jgi:hypothetical protein